MAAIGTIVLQQDHGLRSGTSGQFMVGSLGVLVEGGVLPAVRRCGGGEFGDTGGGEGDVLLIQGAVGDGGDDLGVRRATVGRHLQVKACLDSGNTAADSTPVGDHRTTETPLTSQDVGEQEAAVADRHPVDRIVGAHHRPGLGVLDDAAEAAQVDLVQGSGVDVGADAHPVVLLVVQREVLQRRTDPTALQATDPGGAEHPGDMRVLGVVLEVASTQRGALDVHTWPEEDLDVRRLRFLGECGTDLLDELRVPALRQTRGRREAGGLHAAGEAEVVGGPLLFAQAVGPVGEGE